MIAHVRGCVIKLVLTLVKAIHPLVALMVYVLSERVKAIRPAEAGKMTLRENEAFMTVGSPAEKVVKQPKKF